MLKRGVDVVRKRDGSLARFDILKIKTAIYKSSHAVDYRNGNILDECILNAEALIKKRFKKRIPGVENIQDIVEEVLIKKGLTDVAKSYIIYREKRNQIRQSKVFYNVHDDLKLTVNAIHVLQKRYLLRNEKGDIIENPAEMFKRVAKAVAKAEEFYGKNSALLEDAFYNMMANLDFVPNSPTLMNAGTRSGQLSACFVLPVEDSLAGIFDSLKAMALIQQSGGGTGFSFSKLRGAGKIVGSTKGIASGPVSFIEIFDKTTDVIKQGGKRRGANMAVLRVDHPDIIDFITSKEQEGRLSNFNISVGVTDKFINAVRFNRKFELIDPVAKKVVKVVRAKEIFDLIITFAWKTGDPGIVFLDEINRKHVLLGIIESTNPCGEQPLLPWESCNLGSINLVKFVENNEIDWKGLRSCIRLAVHFLDNVIDVNNYVLPEIMEITRTNRKIGLGVMGFAEMLILLKIPYNSEKALKLGNSLMKFIQTEARQKSYELGIERGSFLSFKQSRLAKKYKAMRNSTVTTIAPTGTISIIAGTSSGIEPLFAVSYVRNVLEGTKLFETNSLFEDIAHAKSFYSPELMMRITRTRNLEGMKDVPDDVKKLFLTAHEISPEWHVKMQAVFQKYTDNAVSKTVNLAENATIKDVEKVFWLAHKLGCKGITIYRYNSKSSQVLNLGDKKTVVLESEFAGGCPITHCGN